MSCKFVEWKTYGGVVVVGPTERGSRETEGRWLERWHGCSTLPPTSATTKSSPLPHTPVPIPPLLSLSQYEPQEVEVLNPKSMLASLALFNNMVWPLIGKVGDAHVISSVDKTAEIVASVQIARLGGERTSF